MDDTRSLDILILHISSRKETMHSKYKIERSKITFIALEEKVRQELPAAEDR